MNQRIRYSQVRQGVLKSRRNFAITSGIEVVVELDLAAKKYLILDNVTGAQISTGGNTKNLAVLKIQAKKGLEALGVTFANETRNRGNTELGVQVG